MVLQQAARRWGATDEEVAAHLPCDDLLPDASVVDRAVDAEAEPATVYRWLCQLRAAPYSYDWIDNFGRRSPRRLTPGLDDLHEGQRFMTIFRLASFERDDHITLRTGRVAVTYRVRPGRLHMRIRGLRRGMPLLDLVMARKQLLTLAELAAATEPARRAPGASGAGRPRPGSRAPSARGRGSP